MAAPPASMFGRLRIQPSALQAPGPWLGLRSRHFEADLLWGSFPAVACHTLAPSSPAACAVVWGLPGRSNAHNGQGVSEISQELQWRHRAPILERLMSFPLKEEACASLSLFGWSRSALSRTRAPALPEVILARRQPALGEPAQTPCSLLGFLPGAGRRPGETPSAFSSPDLNFRPCLPCP